MKIDKASHQNRWSSIRFVKIRVFVVTKFIQTIAAMMSDTVVL